MPQDLQYAPRGVSCQRRVVRGVSEACQRRIIWIKLHSVAMPTALPTGRYRCSEEDIVGTPCAPPWTSAENEPKLNGLKISCPCIGIGNAGVAFQQAGWGYEIVNSCDVEKNLEAALKATEGGSLKGIDLGAEDGNLLNKPMSSLVPSHALLAGPPCPPWPAVRQESQPAAKRQRWNLDPNLTKEFENFTKYTM